MSGVEKMCFSSVVFMFVSSTDFMRVASVEIIVSLLAYLALVGHSVKFSLVHIPPSPLYADGGEF